MKTYIYLILAFGLGMGCQKIKEKTISINCFDATNMRPVEYKPDYVQVVNGLIEMVESGGFKRLSTQECPIITYKSSTIFDN